MMFARGKYAFRYGQRSRLCCRQSFFSAVRLLPRYCAASRSGTQKSSATSAGRSQALLPPVNPLSLSTAASSGSMVLPEEPLGRHCGVSREEDGSASVPCGLGRSSAILASAQYIYAINWPVSAATAATPRGCMLSRNAIRTAQITEVEFWFRTALFSGKKLVLFRGLFVTTLF